MRNQLTIGILFGALGTFALACGGEGATTTEDSQDATSVKFVVLDVVAPSASEGLTVIKTADKYEAFFGEEPPAEVNFKKHWVITASMGNRASGGYSVEVTSLYKEKFEGKMQLFIDTIYRLPGAGCVTTMATTNPQVTVRVSKPAGNPWIEENNEEIETSCTDPDLEGLGEGDVCGGGSSGADDCAEGLFCRYSIEAQCGSAGQAGECTEINKFSMCPSVAKPVCGCNDVTYTNSCRAKNNGVSVAHEGACTN